MPSKLIGMMASGRPVVATAAPDTEIWQVLQGRGLVVPPGDAQALADAIERLGASPEYGTRYGMAARAYVEQNLERDKVLRAFEAELASLVEESQRRLSAHVDASIPQRTAFDLSPRARRGPDRARPVRRGLGARPRVGRQLTIAAVVAMALFLLLGEARRLYGSWRLRSSEDEYANVFSVWVIVCAALVVAAFLLKVSANYSRAAIVAWFLVTPALLMYSRLALRATLRALRRSGRNTRTVAVVGTGTIAE